MEGYPWFKVVAGDLLANEQFSLWSMEERGAYLTLMAMAWREGSIPASYSDLARLVRIDATEMSRLLSGIRSRFNPHPSEAGRLIAPELETQRDANKALSDKRVKAGKAGSNARWHGDSKRMPLPSESHCDGDSKPEWQTDANQNQNQNQKKIETTTPEQTPVVGEGEFPTRGGAYTVPVALDTLLRTTYPLKDVDGELRKARAWLLTSPKRLKTLRGMPKFLNGWMARQPDFVTTPLASKPTLRVAT